MKKWIFALCFFRFLDLASQPVSQTGLFNEAVELVKKYEGWHHARDHPYVGYGHRLLPGEAFRADITGAFADSLLRADLRQKCAVFRGCGIDSLLLGVLAYNVGEGRVSRSKLLKKLKSGDRNIRGEYLSFRKWKGKIIPSLEKRRKAEYDLLFVKTLKNHSK